MNFSLKLIFNEKMFEELELVQISFEGIWRNAMITEARPDNPDSFFVEFDNNDPFIIGVGN